MSGLKYYKRVIALSIAILWLTASGFAQSGANVQGGLVLMQNQSPQVTGADQYHSGYYVGINGRFGSYTWYIAPGAYYYRFDLLSDADPEFFSGKEQFTMVKIPVDLGARIIRNPVFNFRAYAGGVINYLESIDENPHNLTIERFNDIHFGINAGIGVDLWWLTLDVRYEVGLSSFLLDVQDSRSDYLSAGLGIFF